ncbi:MAG: DEAD/DEAH box helicase [Phenylobacterium sp.]|uniref:3'-5' exonuclease n=1 Tax=Phenylobacterium sp. TaxID=1871053 RepID=UPI001A2A977E|nr:3'-5' exonuclease [Phenylobacterium sp.]MBJ7411840.1 DEAD/DEAH box helicase [Phenylobacterium sp.]
MGLPTPVAKQRDVVQLATRGHQVVLGTAGSGKTTMAILRAAYLSHPGLPGGGRTLLLTFNKPLVQYIQALAAPELARVQVENYHLFARGYLNSRGKMNGSSILTGRPREEIVTDAVEEVRQANGTSPLFSRPLPFFVEELKWIAAHGVRTRGEYQDATRVGRAEARLEKADRPLMWQVREAYLRRRQERGRSYDLDDLATAVATEFHADASPRRYRHIVIDEGQDLSPEMLRSLSAAIPPDGSLTFFGDVAQQIYGHRMSWRSAGLKPPRVWEFEQNYRNTAEIAALGLAISQMPYYSGAADMVAPETPRAEGPKPTLVSFASRGAQLAFIGEQARRFAEAGSVAVLTRTLEQMREVRDVLPGDARSLRAARWSASANLYYGSLHSAKGMEFDAVILPFLSEAELPDPDYIDSFGPEDASANDGRLLYVGVTRARRALLLLTDGPASALLPSSSNLYTRLSR